MLATIIASILLVTCSRSLSKWKSWDLDNMPYPLNRIKITGASYAMPKGSDFIQGRQWGNPGEPLSRRSDSFRFAFCYV